MRFRFCGDADCPDWLLMQINTLSEMSAENLQELCQHVMQSLLGGELDYEKLAAVTGRQEDTNDLKASVAAVSQILRRSACHGVRPSELAAELEQLGLQRNQAALLAKVYTQEATALTSALKATSLSRPRPTSITVTAPGVVTITTDEGSSTSFSATPTQLRTLLADLRAIKVRMEEMQA